MPKILFFILSAVLLIGSTITIKKATIIPATAAANVDNYDEYAYGGTYYSGINLEQVSDGVDGSLRTKLTALIEPSSWYQYSSDGTGTLSEQLQECDEDPTNTSNMVLLYTRNSIVKVPANGASNWNREHVWPQSLSNGKWGESKAGTDLLHLRPTYATTNSRRGNLPYGNVAKTSPLTYNSMNYGYASSNYFMPLDSVKGDVARICMYIWVAYYNIYGTSLPELTNVFESFDTLMTWHLEDRPDAMEGNRNDYVQTTKQGNRNPFVDKPEYAWHIFGELCSTTVLNNAKTAYPNNGSNAAPQIEIRDLNQNIVTEATITAGETMSFIGWSNGAPNENVSWSLVDENNETYVGNSYYSYYEGNGATIYTTEGVSEFFYLRLGKSYTSSSGTKETTYCRIPITVTIVEEDDIPTIDPTIPQGLDFEKVTTDLNDFSGTYLIVYEKDTSAYILNGEADTLDSVKNYFKADLLNEKIAFSNEIYSKSFIISSISGGYSIRNQGGLYISNSANSNSLKTGTSPSLNTISVTDGEVSICSNDTYLRFNSQADQTRFRYYKSASYQNQQPISLYRINQDLVDATSYAQKFNKDLICDNGINKPDQSIWNLLATEYEQLSTNAQSYLVNGTYSYDGNVVTSTNGTQEDIAQALAKYDYILSKYGNEYSSFITGRAKSTLSHNPLPIYKDNYLHVLFICFILLFPLSIFVLIKRNKKYEK